MAEKRIVEFKVTPTKNYFAPNESLEFEVCVTIESQDTFETVDIIGKLDMYTIITGTIMLEGKEVRKSSCAVFESFTPEFWDLEPLLFSFELCEPLRLVVNQILLLIAIFF